MRKILAIIFCFISPYIQAQGRFDDYMAKTPAFSITLSLAKRVKQDVPYSHITFLDVRPDTMALGFYSLYSDSFARYTFKNGFINELEKYFSNNFRLSEKAEDSPALLIAIKKFWISGYTSDSSHFIKKDRKKSLVLDAEVYKENNSGFTAFFRMDTIIEYKSDLLAATAADVFSLSLLTLL